MSITQFAATELHVSIASQPVFEVFGIPVTNSMLTGLAGIVLTVAILWYVGGRVKRGKYNRFVGLIQWVFEGLLKQIDGIIPDKKLARKVTPLAITIFFVVLISYWLSVLPGLESITVNGVPLLRSLTADLNFTLALAVITLVTVQIYAVKYLGSLGNAHRYLRNPLKDPIGSFEGILELIGEFSRGVALALRLFGNAFAGEVLLIVIAALTSYASVFVLPPFLAFELFIGFIQAYVFFMLCLIFTALAVAHTPSPDHSPAVANKKAASKA
jgi:F-type H+-transporting ATPase subunit a